MSSEHIIYAPDLLISSNYMDVAGRTLTELKGAVQNEDENIRYKTNMSIAICKVIELANYFERVYLDATDFMFIIANMINNHREIAMNLLNRERISYIDNDCFCPAFFINGNNDNPIRVYAVPCKSTEEIYNGVRENINDYDNRLDGLISNAIKSRMVIKKAPDIAKITNESFLSIVEGQYQKFGLTANYKYLINAENVNIYNYMLRNYFHNRICDYYGIPILYRSEYENSFDRARNEFQYNLGRCDTEENVHTIPNITICVAENDVKKYYEISQTVDNDFFNIIFGKKSVGSSLSKNISVTQYITSEYRNLKFAISSTFFEDFCGKTFIFEKEGEETPIKVVGFN